MVSRAPFQPYDPVSADLQQQRCPGHTADRVSQGASHSAREKRQRAPLPSPPLHPPVPKPGGRAPRAAPAAHLVPAAEARQRQRGGATGGTASSSRAFADGAVT